MKLNTIWEAARDEGRSEGRNEARAAIRARLIAGGMSPEEADNFINPVSANGS